MKSFGKKNLFKKHHRCALPISARDMDSKERGDMNVDTAIPEHFNSAEEAGEFWDTHSAADYWNNMEEVKVEFDI